MRSNTAIRRTLLPATIALVVAPLLVPAAATAATPATPAADACTVTTADLTWGFKESFRSYISGAIAHGEWEVTGGAAYETPDFRFTGGTGTYDPVTATGTISFPGSIRFTGHDGLLDTQVSAPTVVFTGPGAAELRVDISGTSMADALAGNTTVSSVEQVPLVSIDLTGAAVVESTDTVTLMTVDAPTTITAAGFESFGNYEAGTPFDPITLMATAACPVEPSPEPTPEPMMTTMVDAGDQPGTPSSSDSSGLWWGLGTLAALALSAVASIIALRRRPRADGPE